MTKKVSTPVSVLIFFYILIVSLIFIIIGLGSVAAYDFNHYLNNSEDLFALRCCKKYFDQNQMGLYEECYARALEKVREQKEQ